MKNNNITVIGSGAWGRAIAKCFGASQIIAGRAEPAQISADFCFVAVEAQNFRVVLQKHKFAASTVIIIATKGIEQGSLMLPSQIMAQVLPNKFAVLSGPNFAAEIEQGLPAAADFTAATIDDAKQIIAALNPINMRLYPSDDVVAAQVCGAVKNVICIASGICMSQNLGENAKAALITRALAEIGRLAASLGGQPESLLGLSGIGDLMLSAASLKSRNTNFGFEIGSGKSVAELIENRTHAIEGYYTAKSVHELAAKLNIQMPICKSVFEVLYEGKDVKQAVNELISRPQS